MGLILSLISFDLTSSFALLPSETSQPMPVYGHCQGESDGFSQIEELRASSAL